ncbi:hypothetical protein [Pedobacter sp.]
MDLLKIPFSIIIEWMCFFASILFIPKKVQPSYWKAFIVYLGILAIFETCAHLVVKTFPTFKSNHVLYNGFLPIYCFFHFWIFSKVINLKRIRIICLTLAALLSIGYMIEWYHQGFGSYFYRTNTAFSGLVVLLCITYYFSLFKQEEYHDILKDAAFWFVTGCLIFYATNTTVNAFFAEIIRVKIKGQLSIRYAIMNILNILMYSCWMKSFLCLRNKRIYTRASF